MSLVLNGPENVFFKPSEVLAPGHAADLATIDMSGASCALQQSYIIIHNHTVLYIVYTCIVVSVHLEKLAVFLKGTNYTCHTI